MSISPPSDIVLDVARAADPARYSQAAARLGQGAAASATDFSALLANDNTPPAATKPVDRTAAASAGTASPAAAKAFQNFEAMTLSTMIESAMPDSETVFGAGTAGSVWKSMLSDQIAAQMAKNGGIGIAAQLAAARDLTGAASGSGEEARALILGNTHAGFLDALSPDPTAADSDDNA